jgi:hypothetical protein
MAVKHHSSSVSYLYVIIRYILEKLKFSKTINLHVLLTDILIGTMTLLAVIVPIKISVNNT